MRRKHQNQKRILISPQLEKHLNDYNVHNQYFRNNNSHYQSKNFLLFFPLAEYNNIFCVHNSNHISILKNLLYIYSKFLAKKKRYYLYKYHSKIVKSINLKSCTCQYSTFENDSEPNYTLFPSTNRYKNFSTSTEYSKLNSKIANVKIQDFVINNDNSNSYSNYINLNKSEYYFNGNEIGSFSSYNLNSKTPTKNIISVKNGTGNKKYVVKIKLYGNQINPEDSDNNSVKYKKYTKNSNKPKKPMRNNYSFKNINTSSDINNNSNYFYNQNHKSIKLKKFQGRITDRIYHRDYVQTLNRNIKNGHDEENNNKFMNDQEILDYLNTNNNEKKNLIKKILNHKLVHNKQLNEFNKFGNKKKIFLNDTNSYSYKNNNYNYLYDKQTSTTSYISNDRDITSYSYLDNTRNSKIIFTNKNHSLKTSISNNAITYNKYKLEEQTKKLNNLTSNQNHIKKLKKVKSFNNVVQIADDNISYNNINANININPTKKINKIKNAYNQGPRIILLNNKTKLKNSESTNRIIRRQKELYSNNKITLTMNSTNLNKKQEIYEYKVNPEKEKEKEKKKQGLKIVPKYSNNKKMSSLGINTNNIEKSKDNLKAKYKINKAINEQFNKAKEESSSNYEFSVQSLNDSKMMELAKNFIKQEDNLNRNEINEILNCKKSII